MTGASFDGEARRILTWSQDGTARVWDAATGQEVLPPLRHEDRVLGASFDSESGRILTWSVDGAARLWDAATGQEVLLPLRHEGQVLGASFDSKEDRVLTWSEDGTARLWDISLLPPGHLVDIACGLLPNTDVPDIDGIAVDEPICGPGVPVPVWVELEE